MRKHPGRSFVIASLVIASSAALAEVEVAPYFGSHMVVQRDKPVVVWGTANPGEAVDVEFGGDTKVTAANSDGEWAVKFQPRAASFEPIELRVGTVRFDNILVGDVWLNSGQSNMEWPAIRTDDFDSAAVEEDQRVRLLHMQNVRAQAPEGYTDDELERLNNRDFFRGQWEVSGPETVPSFSAVAWAMGERLAVELDVPIGLVQVAVGGSAINSWLPADVLRAHPHTSHLYESDWLSNNQVFINHRKAARASFQHVLTPGEPYIPGEMPYRFSREPAFLFEAGVLPLGHAAFKGVTWYQGEADSFAYAPIRKYRDLLPLLIKSWREHFDDPSLPFIVVQLPGFRNEGWPLFRQMQKEVAETISSTAMVVTIDLGDENDIHPRIKRPVGERLAWEALRFSLDNDAAPRYPRIAQTRHKSDGITLTLRYFEGGNRGTAVPGFEIGDEYSVFYPVTAEFMSRNRVRVNSDIGCPRFLRYGWMPYPKPKLTIVNDGGLPLGPFVIELKNTGECQ